VVFFFFFYKKKNINFQFSAYFHSHISHTSPFTLPTSAVLHAIMRDERATHALRTLTWHEPDPTHQALTLRADHEIAETVAATFPEGVAAPAEVLRALWQLRCNVFTVEPEDAETDALVRAREREK
jgi:hypothetical protein